MSPESLALLQHLAGHGPVTVDELLTRFPAYKRDPLIKRLCNLYDLNWVDRWSEGELTYWSLRASARIRLAKKLALPSEPLPLVPPRQYDVMHGATYQPAPFHIARPGALDASRLPSRGARC